MTPRPRDAAGRPLPFGAAGVEPVPVDPAAPPSRVIDQADQLIGAGRPFAAHEVLEEAWKRRPADERELWRGLAQIAVGLTHLQRGNAVGGSRLLRRGAAVLAGAGAGATAVARQAGIDQAALTRRAVELAADPRWPASLRLRSGGE